MANGTIDMPDELVRRLEGIARRERKTVQQLAVNQLRSPAEAVSQYPPGTAAAVLRAAQAPTAPKCRRSRRTRRRHRLRPPSRPRDRSFLALSSVTHLLDTGVIHALMGEEPAVR